MKDPCPEGEHRIVRNDDEFKIREECGLSIQGIQDWVGHDLTDKEFRDPLDILTTTSV